MDVRQPIILLTGAALLLACGGCAALRKSPPKEDTVHTAFEAQRQEQSRMSDFVASAGRRKTPDEEKSAGLGEMFLLSDRAKEIYANTER